MVASLVSVNLAVKRENPANRNRAKVQGAAPPVPMTGIDKQPVTHPVRVHALGVAGDAVCDLKHHGGIDQAVYAYALEDIQWWARELAGQVAVELVPGCVGENLTTAGLDVSECVIGQRWHVGDAVFEVSVPRIPCSTFAGFWQVENLVKRFSRAGRPGAYLRVLTEGDVQAGDEIVLGAPPAHGLTIGETFSAMLGERSLASKLLTAPELPAKVLASARGWAQSA